ncbi:NUDIX domain-containing protein [Flexivirga sp. ID2601S]|uniref:NUDIX domain-containing protein n=1 Tax=Flexivirga aerilata TaxID=1656889 RepID=A0A849AG13_9MICO|nr:NUDIX domain-containing protein [Flexivirga aerilata]NNG38148.1 NUDIX domain-containing protein [Flexivirga aerilata]
MSHARPGPLRRLGLTLFRWLPTGPSYRLVRLTTPTFSVGAIALIEHDGALLALRQTHRRGVSLPGGLIERGERPEQAVAREVLEETGLRIDPGDAFATVFEPKLRHIDVIFRVLCDREPDIRVASEATDHEWLPLDEWWDIDSATARILAAVRAARHTPGPGRVLRA